MNINIITALLTDALPFLLPESGAKRSSAAIF